MDGVEEWRDIVIDDRTVQKERTSLSWENVKAVVSVCCPSDAGLLSVSSPALY